MENSDERFRNPPPITSKREKKEKPTSPLRLAMQDNRLLFDRPLSYWTIGAVGINAAFIAVVAVGQSPPFWLNIVEPLAAIPWILVFMRGGGWAWLKKYIPEQKAKS